MRACVWSHCFANEHREQNYIDHSRQEEFHTGLTHPFAKTHVMEHVLNVLSGMAGNSLNRSWVDVDPGDCMELLAFFPVVFMASVKESFRHFL